MKYTFTGKVDEFDLTIKVDGIRYNQSLLRAFVDKEISITIDTKKKPRSAAQNSWYWGVAIPIIIERLKEFDGEEYSKEQIHELIRMVIICGDSNVTRILGRPVVTYSDKTTSQMNTTEFNAFKLKLQEFFAHRDIQIPDPNE